MPNTTDPKKPQGGGIEEYQIPMAPTPPAGIKSVPSAPLQPQPQMPVKPIASVPPVVQPLTPPPTSSAPVPPSGMPLPPQNRQVLETKAKVVINEWDKLHPSPVPVTPPGKKKAWVPMAVIGVVSLTAVGLGVWGGLRLLNTPQSADLEQQAYIPPGDEASTIVCDQYTVSITETENTSCPQLDQNQCLAGTATPNEVSSYSTTWTVKVQLKAGVPEDTKAILKITKKASYCPNNACGEMVDGKPVCNENVVETPTEPAEKEFQNNQSLDFIVTSASPDNNACGSFQTALKVQAMNCEVVPSPTSPPPGEPTNPPTHVIYGDKEKEIDGFCQTGRVCGSEPGLVCKLITMKPTTPTIGSSVTFTCSGEPTTSARAEFQAAVGTGDFASLTNSNATEAAMTVTSAGSHQVRCRWCVGEGTEANCTPWQAAQ